MNNPVTTFNYSDFSYSISTIGAFLQFDFDVPAEFVPFATRQYLNCNELKVIQRGVNDTLFELCNQNFTLILDSSLNETNDFQIGVDRDWETNSAGT